MKLFRLMVASGPHEDPNFIYPKLESLPKILDRRSLMKTLGRELSSPMEVAICEASYQLDRMQEELTLLGFMVYVVEEEVTGSSLIEILGKRHRRLRGEAPYEKASQSKHSKARPSLLAVSKSLSFSGLKISAVLLGVALIVGIAGQGFDLLVSRDILKGWAQSREPGREAQPQKLEVPEAGKELATASAGLAPSGAAAAMAFSLEDIPTRPQEAAASPSPAKSPFARMIQQLPLAPRAVEVQAIDQDLIPFSAMIDQMMQLRSALALTVERGARLEPRELSLVAVALNERFLACYAEEADISDEERATMMQFRRVLAQGLARSRASRSKAARRRLRRRRGYLADRILDPRVVASWSCAGLAAKLQAAAITGGLEPLFGSSAPEPWAARYGEALKGGVQRCLTGESQDTPSADQLAKLNLLGGSVARALTLMSGTGLHAATPKERRRCLEQIKGANCMRMAGILRIAQGKAPLAVHTDGQPICPGST